MITDVIIPDFKEIRGRGRILVPLLDYVDKEIPKTVNIVNHNGIECIQIVVKKSIPIVPLSITFIWGISRKQVVRKAREGLLAVDVLSGHFRKRS